MPEQPEPGESFILGYSADDAAYPILAVSHDPREFDTLPAVSSTTGLSAEHIAEYPLVKFVYVQSPTQADTRTLWRYERLPGPWIPDNRDDLLLGPVQRQRRAVLNSGQVVSETPTGKTTYEGRDGSSIVSWEIVETYSDGTGAPGAAVNPAFPQVEAPLFYDDERGSVHSHSQLVRIVWKVTAATITAAGTGTNGAVTLIGTTGTGTKFQVTGTVTGGVLAGALVVWAEGAYTIRPTTITAEPVTATVGVLTGATLSLTLEPTQTATFTATATLATLVRYEKFNEFLLEKVTEYWTLPGPERKRSHYEEESKVLITETRRMKQRAAITESYTVAGADPDGILTIVEIEPSRIAAEVATELTTVYPVADAKSTGTAIIWEEEGPYQAPGRVNFTLDTGGHYSIVTYGIRASTSADDPNPSAILVTHTIKTWYINSTTKPTLTIQEFKPKTVSLYDGVVNRTFNNVLFNAATLVFDGFSSVAIAATTPTYTAFLALIGTAVIIDGSVKETRRCRWKVQTISVVMF